MEIESNEATTRVLKTGGSVEASVSEPMHGQESRGAKMTTRRLEALFGGKPRRTAEIARMNRRDKAVEARLLAKIK